MYWDYIHLHKENIYNLVTRSISLGMLLELYQSHGHKTGIPLYVMDGWMDSLMTGCARIPHNLIPLCTHFPHIRTEIHIKS